MPSLLLHTPSAELPLLLDDYANDFEWYSFCLAWGHTPSQGQDRLQSLYQCQARWRGHRMQELYPLVCAHWDVVNLSHDLAQARSEAARKPLEGLLRRAKAHHRAQVRALRAAWDAHA